MSDDRAAISAIVLTAMGDAWSDSEEYSALPGVVADLLLTSDWLAAEKAKWQAEGAVSALRQAANLAEPFSGAALPSSPSRPMFAAWLRDRADHIEKGSDDDR